MQYKIVAVKVKQIGTSGEVKTIYRVKERFLGIFWRYCRGRFYGDLFVPPYILGFHTYEEAQNFIDRKLCPA